MFTFPNRENTQNLPENIKTFMQRICLQYGKLRAVVGYLPDLLTFVVNFESNWEMERGHCVCSCAAVYLLVVVAGINVFNAIKHREKVKNRKITGNFILIGVCQPCSKIQIRSDCPVIGKP